MSVVKEKAKKYLTVLAQQTAVAVGIFVILFALSRIMPQVTEKISVIWTKNTDLKRVAQLFLEIFSELVPF